MILCTEGVEFQILKWVDYFVSQVFVQYTLFTFTMDIKAMISMTCIMKNEQNRDTELLTNSKISF